MLALGILYCGVLPPPPLRFQRYIGYLITPPALLARLGWIAKCSASGTSATSACCSRSSSPAVLASPDHDDAPDWLLDDRTSVVAAAATDVLLWPLLPPVLVLQLPTAWAR